jgi:BlaI family transcriptional regulator, penicillinase repressor
MQDLRDLPQAEFEAMDVLWNKGEATIKEVVNALSSRKKLAYTTVATLLTRLKEKGYVEAEERNFAYVFRPVVDRAPVLKRKLDDLVDRVLGGRIEPLAAYIAQKGNLTPEHLAALEEIVRSVEEG